MRWILLAFLLAAPCAAQAASIVDLVTIKDCDPSTGVLSNEKLRDKILAANKVPFSSQTLALYTKGDFGGELAKLYANCNPTAGCKGDKAVLPRTYAAVTPLLVAAPDANPGFHITVDPAAPQPAERPAAFLNGDWAWLKITCDTAPAPAPAEDKPGSRTDTFFGPPAFVIAKSEDDAGKDFDKRGFATAGYSSDKVANKTALDLDIFLGFTDPFRRRDSSLSLQPFAAYQRHSAKKVDDLSFGLAALSYPMAGGQVRLKGAWETDHRFDSSVWRADLGWTTPLLDFCETYSVETFYATCELTAVGDYADIAHAGKKADLAKLSSFTRIGGDLQLEFGVAVGDAGFVTFTGKYSGRHDVSGHEGDAELGTLSLGFAPSKTGPYKVSIDYTHGRDLTSLAKQRTVVLSVGFRH